MKILIFYTYNKSYLSSFFFELSLKLFRDGHDVKNFSLKTKNEQFLNNGVEIIIKKKGTYLTNYYHIFSVIKNVRPDLIISNFSYVNPALLFGNLFEVNKNVVWFHSLREQIKPTPFKIFIKSLFLKLADTVIANSHEMKNELFQSYKLSINKLYAIPFWTTISELNSNARILNSPNDKNILKIGCPGRLEDHKNQKIVIEALFIIKQKNYKAFELYIAGSGTYLSEIKKLVNDLMLTENVIFLGHLSEEDMLRFYHEMNVIVLPSLHEAFGLVFIEAISLGVPVIASNKFGALSFIQKNGEHEIVDYTFNPEMVSELCIKLMKYFNNDGIPGDYFLELYQKNFDKDIIYNQINEVLKI